MRMISLVCAVMLAEASMLGAETMMAYANQPGSSGTRQVGPVRLPIFWKSALRATTLLLCAGLWFGLGGSARADVLISFANTEYGEAGSVSLATPLMPDLYSTGQVGTSRTDYFQFNDVLIHETGGPIEGDVALVDEASSLEPGVVYTFLTVGPDVELTTMPFTPPNIECNGQGCEYFEVATDQPIFTGAVSLPTLLDGSYGYPGQDMFTITSETPEPASIVLLGSGLLGFVLLTGRRGWWKGAAGAI